MRSQTQTMKREEANLVREAVGIFYSHEKMQEAIEQLEASGFDRRLISVLGSEEALKEQYGTADLDMRQLEDDPAAPRDVKFNPNELGIAEGVLIGGGAYAGVVTALLASGAMVIPGALVTTAILGGAIGATAGGVLAKLLGDEYSGFFQKQIEKGGLLLWVQTPEPHMEQTAQSILQSHGAHDVHVHTIHIEA